MQKASLDLPLLLKLALEIAIKLGARQLAAGILRKHARALRKHYESTPTKDDDVWGEAIAKLFELAANVADDFPLENVMPKVKQAIAPQTSSGTRMATKR